MNSKEEQLDTLKDIRNMMDRSSRFISLSGLSGIFAGLTALVGAFIAERVISNYHAVLSNDRYDTHAEAALLAKLINIAIIVLLVAIAGGVLFTVRQSRRKNLPVWDRTAKNLLVNLAIPLVSGGLFIIAILWVHADTYMLIAPCCLLFYGLALVNASKYTYRDIRFLGISEILVGLFSVFYANNGLLFWTIGFGFLHIVYGLVMYFKYEQNTK